MKRFDTLLHEMETVLLGGMPQRLKEAIDLGLKKGISKAVVLRIAQRRLEVEAPLMHRAVEFYIERWRQS